MRLSFSLKSLALPALVLLCPAAWADSAAALDQTNIHALYNDGDFEKVLKVIDTYTHEHKTYSREDSIFIAKHLAVIYSADPKRREKGKFYMYRLLELVPSAQLVDMYVSDEIDRIFDKVRVDFLTRQKSFGVDSTKVSIPEKAPVRDSAVAAAPAAKPKSKRKVPVGYWIAGGAGVVVAGALTIHLLQEQERGSDLTYSVGR